MRCGECPRHVYNCMNAREQAEYEEKREQVKPAYRLYLDEERTRFHRNDERGVRSCHCPWCRKRSACSNCLTGTEACPHRLSETVGTKARGFGHEKYRAEAMRFAGQVMLATGYFNTRLPTEQPKTEINYTELRLSYSNGIVFYFVADRSRDGVCGCYLQRITLDGKRYITAVLADIPASMTFCKDTIERRMPKCPLPFYRVDDKPSRTVKVRGLSLYAVSTGTTSF